MIWLLGDTHGQQAQHVLRALESTRPDEWPKAAIYLGDMESERPFHEEVQPLQDAGIEVWWIPGNHDTEHADTYRNIFESELADRNLHGRVVEIAGLRVAGLGGVFRGKIWYPGGEDPEPKFQSYQDFLKHLNRIRPRRERRDESDLRPQSAEEIKHLSSIFPDVVEALTRQRAEILVTHEAPSCHPYGFEVLDNLARAMGIKHVFHGHHHEHRNYDEFNSANSFSVFSVDFRGIMDHLGGLIGPGGRIDGFIKDDSEWAKRKNKERREFAEQVKLGLAKSTDASVFFGLGATARVRYRDENFDDTLNEDDGG